MTAERMGKVLLLRRIREEEERGAVASAAAAEACAIEREASAEAQRSGVAETLSRAEREGSPGGAAAQLLQLQARFLLRLRSLERALEGRLAAARGERSGASEAAGRARASLATSRRSREALEQRWEAARLDARRRAEQRGAEQAQDDRTGLGMGKEKGDPLC